MERTTGNEANASKSESEAKARDQRAPAADDAHRTPSKKRRKVNHGEFWWRPIFLHPTILPPGGGACPDSRANSGLPVPSQPASTAVDL
jgi:hypothetical protein